MSFQNKGKDGAADGTEQKRKTQRASAADQLQFLADSVNGDKFLPQTMITISKARELITAGLVTRERMRERGVQF